MISTTGNSVKNVGEIKKKLEERQFELEQILIKLYQEKFSDSHVKDFADEALSSTMEFLQASLSDSRLDEYKRVTKALQMIEEGSYGICIDCSGAISEIRLKSYPNATRCIACQESYEEAKGERFP